MRAYERLLQYAAVHTTSSGTSGKHPSFKGEWDLARILAGQLEELGLTDVRLDAHCYVYGKLPATEGYENAPALGFIAHIDTSEEADGKGVKPVLHENYAGGDLILPAGNMLSPKYFPFMKKFIGETVITSDGSTLLGADDKAGVAEIMTALERIKTEKLAHGPLCICFTPDEEIGEGTDYFDIEGFGAKYAYTVDGGDANILGYETFNAASAEVVIHGRSTHPGTAKGMMRNSVKVAMEYQALLPADECPEMTEDREGFFHLLEMHGRAEETRMEYLIRDHDRQIFEKRKRVMQEAAEDINRKYGLSIVTVTITDTYSNMVEKILPHKHLIENALEAIRSAGMEPETEAVRGGTDGAMLSFKGLPCPNLGTGGYNFHGRYECITAERMDRATEVILRIIDRYKDFQDR